jgi:hypothetical protein
MPYDMRTESGTRIRYGARQPFRRGLRLMSRNIQLGPARTCIRPVFPPLLLFPKSSKSGYKYPSTAKSTTPAVRHLSNLKPHLIVPLGEQPRVDQDRPINQTPTCHAHPTGGTLDKPGVQEDEGDGKARGDECACDEVAEGNVGSAYGKGRGCMSMGLTVGRRRI